MTSTRRTLLALVAGLLLAAPVTTFAQPQPPGEHPPHVGAHVAGELWVIAAHLQSTLSDEQKTELIELATERPARERRMERSRRGRVDRGRRDRKRNRRMDGRRDDRRKVPLSPAQHVAAQALRAAHVESMKEIANADSLSKEDIRAAAAAKREAYLEAVRALLTDEQRAAVENARNVQDEARREALGLTAEQDAALSALHEKHLAQIKELAGKGDIDRHAARALRASHEAALAEFLTPEQLETARIHRALLTAAMKGRVGDRRGRHR